MNDQIKFFFFILRLQKLQKIDSKLSVKIRQLPRPHPQPFSTSHLPSVQLSSKVQKQETLSA